MNAPTKVERITANLEAISKRFTEIAREYVAKLEQEARLERLEELRELDEDHRCLAYKERLT